MIIYKVTNSINGKIYIGQTIKSLEYRKYNHVGGARRNPATYFLRVLKKYGADSFKWQVICICPNLNSLNEQERYYISLYDSFNNGYNLNKGGGGTYGYKISEETRNKLRKAKQNMSDETKKRMSISKRGKKNCNYGKPLSKKHRKRISESQKGENNFRYGIPLTKDHKEKLRQSHLGKILSVKHKRKMSESHKKRWAKIKEKQND